MNKERVKKLQKVIEIPMGIPPLHRVLQTAINKKGDVNSGLKSIIYKNKVKVEAHGTVNALLKRIKSQ